MLGRGISLGRAHGARSPQERTFYNANGTLVTPTYDGSGQTVHPDVFDAGEGNTVHGYRYWMAHTPYPGGNDDFENPSILASNDGKTWELPPGAADPLQAFPGGSTHYADADLVVEPDGTMHFTYLYVNGETTEVRLLSSSDGWDTFTGPTTILSDTVLGYLSQTIVRVSATDWRLWVGDYKTNPNRLLYFEATSIAGPWGTPTVCSVDGVRAGKDLWHYDVRPDPAGDGWHGLFFCSDLGVSGGGSEGYLARSADGLHWTLGRLILPLGRGGFDNTYAYRGALIPDDDVDGDYRVWYSGSNAGVHRVGYTEVPRARAPEKPSGLPDLAAFLAAAALDSPVYVLPLDDVATGTPSNPTGTNTATADVGSDGTYVGTPARGRLGMATDGVNDRVSFTPSGLGLAQPQTWEVWAYNPDPLDAASVSRALAGTLSPVTRAPLVFGSFTGVAANEVLTIANHQAGGGMTFFGGFTVPAGIHHHAIVYDGTANGWTYYLDGVATGTKLSPYLSGAQGFTNEATMLGGYYDAWSQWWDIAGLVIFAAELTASDVADHYAAALA